MSRKKVFEVERAEDEWVVRFKPRDFHLLPTQTKKHIVSAGREALMALRSILDSAISRAEAGGEESAPESIAIR